MSEKKPWHKRWQTWAGVFVAFVVLGAILPDPPEEKKEALEQEKPATYISTSNLTEEDRKKAKDAIEEEQAAKEQREADRKERADKIAASLEETQKKAKEVENTLTIRTNKEIIADSVKEIYGKDAFVSVEYVDGIDIAVVQIKKEVGWSAKSLKTLVLSDTVKFLEFAQGIGELKGVDLRVLSPLKDEYGNITDGRVMDIRFERPTLDKINYENVNYKKLPEIADKYWEHPDMS